jgi:hypothetical protein
VSKYAIGAGLANGECVGHQFAAEIAEKIQLDRLLCILCILCGEMFAVDAKPVRDYFP